MNSNSRLILYSICLYSLIPALVAGQQADNLRVRHDEAQTTKNGFNSFSGATFVQAVDGNGTLYPSSIPIGCPLFAPESCEALNWCCPADNTCTQLPNNIVGCCPSGNTCSDIQLSEISTVTVTITETLPPTPVAATDMTMTPTPVLSLVLQELIMKRATASTITTVTTVTTNGGVFIKTITSVTKSVPTGACSTLTMNGAPLPTLFYGYCPQGVAIVSGDASRVDPNWRSLGWIVLMWPLL